MTNLEHLTEPCVTRLPEFTHELEVTRKSLKRSDWIEYTRKSVLLRKWRYFLALDPYTRWGMIKPRGYAGDATLMDFAYGHSSISDIIAQSGPIGESIYRYTSAAPQSASARKRLELISAEIKYSSCKNEEVKIASIACGHARELEMLDTETKTKITEFFAIDADQQSLDELKHSTHSIPTQTVKKNVIKADLIDLSRFSLVYSLGLFDYLDFEPALSVLTKMLAVTKPGGMVIIANLAPDAANLAYCEAIMDWWMITRTEAELVQLVEELKTRTSDVAEAAVNRLGCFNYLRLSKS